MQSKCTYGLPARAILFWLFDYLYAVQVYLSTANRYWLPALACAVQVYLGLLITCFGVHKCTYRLPACAILFWWIDYLYVQSKYTYRLPACAIHWIFACIEWPAVLYGLPCAAPERRRVVFQTLYDCSFPWRLSSLRPVSWNKQTRSPSIVHLLSSPDENIKTRYLLSLFVRKEFLSVNVLNIKPHGTL